MKTLLIYDEIVTPADRKFWGLGIDAESFAAELAANEDPELEIRINSPGGCVDNGLAIYNLLLAERRKGRKVVCRVDGAAHSAASIIAMAGDTVCMAASSSMLVHDPWAFAVGNADDMRAAAGRLDTAKDKLIPAYKEKTGLSAETISALMTAETELLPAKARELRFADEVEEAPERVQAKVWAADKVRHPLARAALQSIQARADRHQARLPAPPQGATMPEPETTPPAPQAATPPPAAAPASPPAPPAQPTEQERRSSALAKLQAKGLPQQLRAAAEGLPVEALEKYAEGLAPFPGGAPAAASQPSDMPAAPPPLPPRQDKPAPSAAQAAVARRLGVDPSQLAAHASQPWHARAQAQAGPSIEEMLEEAAGEVPAAEPVTKEQQAVAGAFGLSAAQLEAHRKAPWHKTKRS